MFKIVRQLYDERLGLVAAFLFAIFPPFIMYNSQTMTENLAMPFFLISVYYFVLLIKPKSLIMAVRLEYSRLVWTSA